MNSIRISRLEFSWNSVLFLAGGMEAFQQMKRNTGVTVT